MAWKLLVREQTTLFRGALMKPLSCKFCVSSLIFASSSTPWWCWLFTVLIKFVFHLCFSVQFRQSSLHRLRRQPLESKKSLWWLDLSHRATPQAFNTHGRKRVRPWKITVRKHCQISESHVSIQTSLIFHRQPTNHHRWTNIEFH